MVNAPSSISNPRASTSSSSSSSSSSTAIPTSASASADRDAYLTDHGTPVYITLWDLLPPSRLSTAAYYAGLGIFHTNVWMPDLSIEYAFGGHDVDGVTGIFALPRDPLSLDDPSSSSSSDPSSSGRIQVDGISALGPTGIPSPGPSPLPDARYLASYFLGYAGPEESASASAGTSVDAGNVAGKGERRSGRWAAPQWGPAAFCEPGIRSPSMWSFGAKKKGKDNTRSWSWGTKTKSNSDTGAIRIEQPSQASKGEDLPSLISPSKRVHPRHSGARARSLTFVLKTLQEMKQDPDWHGRSYDLLNRNCNHFTDELVNRLTGARLPSWINRTAAIGSTFSCLVPGAFIDLDTSIGQAEVDADADANPISDKEDRDDPSRAYARSHNSEDSEGRHGYGTGTGAKGALATSLHQELHAAEQARPAAAHSTSARETEMQPSGGMQVPTDGL